MTNYKHYENEIKKYTRVGLSFSVDEKTGKLVPCTGFACKDCIFAPKSANQPCDGAKIKWVDEEYVEPELDWYTVAVDTKIYVRDEVDHEWLPRYFAKYEDGKVYAWDNGTTLFSVKSTDYCTCWAYAKLA